MDIFRDILSCVQAYRVLVRLYTDSQSKIIFKLQLPAEL